MKALAATLKGRAARLRTAESSREGFEGRRRGRRRSVFFRRSRRSKERRSSILRSSIPSPKNGSSFDPFGVLRFLRVKRHASGRDAGRRSLRAVAGRGRGSAGLAGCRAPAHRARDRPRLLHRRIGRSHRHDDARRAGRLSPRSGSCSSAARSSRSSRPSSAATPSSPARRARRLQQRARSARRRELAGVGLGDHGDAHAAAGRRHVRRRRAGAARPGAGRSGEGVGRDVPGDHARGAARRRLRADRAVRDGQGGVVHAAHGLRGGRAAAPARRRDDGRSRAPASVSSCRRPAWSRRSPCSASPASARRSW